MIEEAWLKVIEEEGMTGAAAYVRMDEEMVKPIPPKSYQGKSVQLG